MKDKEKEEQKEKKRDGKTRGYSVIEDRWARAYNLPSPNIHKHNHSQSISEVDKISNSSVTNGWTNGPTD